MLPFLLVGLTALASCGPIPVEQAEAQCFERARLALSPRGEVFAGITTDGPRAGLELNVSSDFIRGRDPAAVYDACVFQKSGQPPRQPLYTRTDWRD